MSALITHITLYIELLVQSQGSLIMICKKIQIDEYINVGDIKHGLSLYREPS